MNNYLLDTHCLLWFQGNCPMISQRAMEIIQDTENTILFSQINLFEITIKQKINKLPDFKTDISSVYNQAIKDNFVFLPVLNNHLFAYQNIPLIEDHRDPFDRLLIATAIEENAMIITVDKKFSLYNGIIITIW